MGVYLHFRLYAVATLLFSNRRVLKMMMNMGRKDLSGNRKNTVMMSLLFLALLISFVGGCAAFKCGKKEPSPHPQSQAVMGDCEGSCRLRLARADHRFGDRVESAPDGSVVSGDRAPQADPQGSAAGLRLLEGSTTANISIRKRSSVIEWHRGFDRNLPSRISETTPTPVPQTDHHLSDI